MLKFKKIKRLLFTALIVSTLIRGGLLSAGGNNDTQPQTTAVSTPFSRGFNFTGWFELYGLEEIHFGRYSEQDFADVKSLGADVIRLPVHFHRLTSGAPDYTITPCFLGFLIKLLIWRKSTNFTLSLISIFLNQSKAWTKFVTECFFPYGRR